MLTRRSFHITPAIQSSIKTIIFDVGDVLFESNTAKHASKLFTASLTRPSLLYSFFTLDIRDDLFKVLSSVPAQTDSSTQIMYNSNQPMPQIMVDWMLSINPCEEILQKSLSTLATLDYSKNQKTVLKKIIETLFIPSNFAHSVKPIRSMIKLVESLKNHGYKLCILSNWDKESFPLLQRGHHKLFNKFDQIMISGEEGSGKPNEDFYNKLLQAGQLTPNECIFIDDEPNNLPTAQELGIKCILKTSPDSVFDELKKLGVIKS